MHVAIGVGEDQYLALCQTNGDITGGMRQQAYRALFETDLREVSLNQIASRRLGRRVDKHDFEITKALLPQTGEALWQRFSGVERRNDYRHARHQSAHALLITLKLEEGLSALLEAPDVATGFAKGAPDLSYHRHR